MYEIHRAPEACKLSEPVSLTEPIPTYCKFQPPLRAELCGSNIATITATTATDIISDIIAVGSTPVLILCSQFCWRRRGVMTRVLRSDA